MCRAPSGQSEEEEEREQKSRYEGLVSRREVILEEAIGNREAT